MLQKKRTNEMLESLLRLGAIERISRLDIDRYLVLWRDDELDTMWQVGVFDTLGTESAILKSVKLDKAVELFEQTLNNLGG